MIENKGTIQLETERLILRKVKFEDVDSMFENCSTKENVARYLTWTITDDKELIRNMIEGWINSYTDLKFYQWAIELKETGEFIGTVTGQRVKTKFGLVELAYCLGEKYWNKGYATEAVKKVCDFFFELGYEIMVIEHAIGNSASGKVALKCGFKYETTLRRRVVNAKGEKFDLAVYSKLKEEA